MPSPPSAGAWARRAAGRAAPGHTALVLVGPTAVRMPQRPLSCCFRGMPPSSAGSGPPFSVACFGETFVSFENRPGWPRWLRREQAPPSFRRRCLCGWAEGPGFCLSTPWAGPAAGLCGAPSGPLLCWGLALSCSPRCFLPPASWIGAHEPLPSGISWLRARPGAAQGSLGPGCPLVVQPWACGGLRGQGLGDR